MLYIMRHGSTDWNVLHRLQGHTDIPLNAEGRRMAEEASKAYRKVPLDFCFSSPLIRARETAEIVLRGRGIPVLTDDRLREMSFGDYEGTGYGFEPGGSPINVIFTNPEQYTVSVGGAETFDELFARTGEFLQEVINPLIERGKDILIVGHGAMNLSIIGRIRNIPLKDFWTPGIESCRMIRLL